MHPDKDYPDRHKYLLYIAAELPNEAAEFFCVIVKLMKRDKNSVEFLTAYDINQKTFQEYGGIGPRIYPEPKKKTKRR
ncbi:MAG: hypothetical protein OHK0029_24750 [Armatimonadaceae bacterium]